MTTDTSNGTVTICNQDMTDDQIQATVNEQLARASQLGSGLNEHLLTNMVNFLIPRKQ